MLHPVITLLDGTEVYVNLINAEVSRSIAKQPHLVGLVKEILQKKTLTGLEVRIQQDMGRIVGHDFVITTKEDGNIFYAKVLHEETYTRFIKHGEPRPTQYVAITLKRGADDRAYELCSVRIGRLVPLHPDMSSGSAESRRYWETHALIHTGEPLQARTISKDCPY
jgi:hypothetical protein